MLFRSGHEFANIIEALTAISMVFAISAQVKEDKEVGFDFDYDLIMFFPDGYKEIINFQQEYKDCIKLENEETMESDLIN